MNSTQMAFLRRISLTACLFFAAACGGSGSQTSGSSGHSNQDEYVEAGVVGGIAVTAAIIKAARSQARPMKSVKECCAICDDCSFPCGDSCLTTGNICLRPDGCACYDSQLPIGDRPPRSELPCLDRPAQGGSDAVVIPLGVAY